MNRQIKVGALLGYVNMFIKIIISFLYTPMLLKYLGQSEYGLYSLIASIIAYFSVLDMGFGNSMIRFVSKSQAKKENSDKINGMFLFMYAVIGLIATVIGFIILCNFKTLFSASLTASELARGKILFIILLINVVFSFPLSVFDSYALASERFIFLKILAILKSLLVPIISIVVLLLGYKSIAIVIIIVSFNLFFHLLSLIYCFKKLNMKISLKVKEYDKTLFKEIFAYSFFIFLNIIVDNVFNNTDQIILGSVCGTIAVSIYSVAAQVTQMNTLFSTTISGLFLPKVTKTLEEKNGDKKVSKLFIDVSKKQLYIMILILSGFIVFGKMFITLWTGKEYIDSYYIILLLIGPSIIPLTQNLGISIIQAKNRHQFRSVMYISIAILNVLISIPLAQKYAGIGAAIGSALAIIAGQIITMNIYYWKVIKIDIPEYWFNFFKLGIPVSGLTFLSLLIIKSVPTSWISLILGIIIFLTVYLIICYMISDKDSKKSFWNAIKIMRIKRKGFGK